MSGLTRLAGLSGWPLARFVLDVLDLFDLLQFGCVDLLLFSVETPIHADCRALRRLFR
jgi:hypothetical protein